MGNSLRTCDILEWELEMQRDMETAELAALQRSVHDGGQQAEAAVQYTVMDVEGEGKEEDDGEATAHEEAPIEVTDSTSA